MHALIRLLPQGDLLYLRFVDVPTSDFSVIINRERCAARPDAADKRLFLIDGFQELVKSITCKIEVRMDDQKVYKLEFLNNIRAAGIIMIAFPHLTTIAFIIFIILVMCL